MSGLALVVIGGFEFLILVGFVIVHVTEFRAGTSYIFRYTPVLAFGFYFYFCEPVRFNDHNHRFD